MKRYQSFRGRVLHTPENVASMTVLEYLYYFGYQHYWRPFIQAEITCFKNLNRTPTSIFFLIYNVLILLPTAIVSSYLEIQNFKELKRDDYAVRSDDGLVLVGQGAISIRRIS